MSELTPETRPASAVPNLGAVPAGDAVPASEIRIAIGDASVAGSVPVPALGTVDAPMAGSVPVPGVVAVPGSVPASGPGPGAVPVPVPVSGSAAASLAQGYPGSVWLTGQQQSRALRQGRYTPESITHPGKMLPTIARYAINTYTDPGDLVLDPMAGIGTTMVEAMHLDRRGVGVEYEDRWAALAAVNVALAEKQGASGTGVIYTGDSRNLATLLPPQMRGTVALVITSPPYGSSTHGHVRTPGARRGKVRKIHHSYGGSDNLAYRDHDTLAAGFTEILAGCRAVLRPGGHVVITARPYRRHGELIDIPGMVVAAGEAAGLELVEECVALMAGVRDGVLVPRASFFQQKNVGDAIADGDPQWLVQHEDVIVLRRGQKSASSAEPKYARRELVLEQPQDLRHHSASSWSDTGDAGRAHSLDVSSQARVDRRPQPVPPANAHPGGGTNTPPAHLGRDAERTPDPCPRHPHPMPGSVPADTADRQRSADHHTSPPQHRSSDAAGHR
jgi:hypothetical protein